MTAIQDAACARAAEAARLFAERGELPAKAAGATITSWYAIGDPQTSPARLFTVLEREGLLAEDGWLAPNIGLLSIGDHFDFHGAREDVERAGREVLAWLASHPRTQVPLLAGNHDLARVMELAFESDDSFAGARQLAAQIHEQTATLEAFHAQYPHIPTPGIARRDYSSFSESQRRLVQHLLLTQRFRLAATATLGGKPVVLTHAGVTRRELSLLGLPDDSRPATIAAELNALLDRAVADVSERWRRGVRAALALAPVHVAGTTGREGGGLLYHRPARRDRPGQVDRGWEIDAECPRRFEPSALPRCLVQIAGHSGHGRCRRELEGWLDASAEAEHLALRTLHRDPPRYVGAVDPNEGCLIMIDPGLAEGPLSSVQLLRLDTVTQPQP